MLGMNCTSSRRQALGLAVTVATGMALAGAASAQTRTGVTDTTIKIGMTGPLTGPVSIYGYPINNGAIALYRDINAKGGINGRRIEIVHEDGGCDPAKTVAAFKKLIHRDQVFMIHGESCSAAALAAMDEIKENKVPYVVMAATVDKISAPVNPYIFTTTLPASYDGQIMGNFVASIPNVKRVAIVKHTDEWADSKTVLFVDVMKKSGIEVVTTEQLNRNITDATAQVLKIQQAKVDATAAMLYPAETAVFLRDAEKYGLKGPFLATTSVMDLNDLAARAGSPTALKDVYTTAFLKAGPGSPDVKKFEDIYRAQFPNDKLQALSFYGMSGAVFTIDALTRAGKDLTREGLVAAMEATKGLDASPGFCMIEMSSADHQGCKTGTMWKLEKDQIVNIGPKWRLTN